MLGFGALGQLALGQGASQSTGISGTLDATLAAVVASSTGTLAIKGTLSKTLGDATLAATGERQSGGRVDQTLAPLTSTATGTLPIVGTLSGTLADVTLVSTGAGGNVTPQADPGAGSGKHRHDDHDKIDHGAVFRRMVREAEQQRGIVRTGDAEPLTAVPELTARQIVLAELQAEMALIDEAVALLLLAA